VKLSARSQSLPLIGTKAASAFRPRSRKLTCEKVISSVEKEIDFYRKKQMLVYGMAIAAQVVVITGQQRVSVANPSLASWIYTLFFLLIAPLSCILAYSYARRVYHLRDQRIRLIKDAGFKNVFQSHRDTPKPSPSWLYLSSISLLSLVGTLWVWMGQ
jgi:hypothetical protein